MKRLALLLLCLLMPMPAQAAGEFVWQLAVGGPDSDIGDVALVNAVATDMSGNVVIAGQFEGTVNFGGSNLSTAGDKDIVVASYTSGGAHSWSQRFGSTGSDQGFGVGTDSSGNVYVVGQFSGTVNFGGGNLLSSGSTDIFVLKLTSAGAFVWAVRFGGTGIETSGGIAVASDGTFAITGSYGNFGNAVDFGGGPLTPKGGADIFVAKYDSAGVHQWSRSIGGNSQDNGLAVAINASGEVAATGFFKDTITMPCMTLTAAGPSGNADGVAFKYTSSGGLTWIRRFGGVSDDRGSAVALSSSGEAVITGYFNSTANFGGTDRVSTGGADIFLAKYSSSGSWLWDSAFGTGTTLGDAGRGVALDASGNIALTGFILGPTNFGGGALCPLCSTYDVFVAKFSSSGSHSWSKRFDTVTQDEHGNGVAFDSSGNVIIVGDFFDTVDFGGGALSSPGGVSGFLAKFNP